MRIRTAVPAALAAAVLLGTGATATAATTAASHQSGLHLGFIQYNSPGSDDRSNRSLNAEWVNIHNNTGSSIQLRGYVLKDDTGYRYTFPSYRIGAGKTVKVHTGKGSQSAGHVYWGRGAYVWNNTSDKARLYKPNGDLRDSCAWTTRDNGTKQCH
ncbi:lamin tail domain-containing protein [Streptomyces sp. 8N706]|uniref:lamin tail domain-containing protein n=1 Tax=Streptomyces sp. 8N706 TaxID=3457416 RepID=UPI003FD08841